MKKKELKKIEIECIYLQNQARFCGLKCQKALLSSVESHKMNKEEERLKKEKKRLSKKNKLLNLRLRYKLINLILNFKTN